MRRPGIRRDRVLHAVLEAHGRAPLRDLRVHRCRLLGRHAALRREQLVHANLGVGRELGHEEVAVVAHLDVPAVREALERQCEMCVSEVAERARDVAPDVDDHGLRRLAKRCAGHQEQFPSRSHVPTASASPSNSRGGRDVVADCAPAVDGLSGVVEVVLDCIVKILRETPPNRHRPTERAWPNALFGNAHQQATSQETHRHVTSRHFLGRRAGEPIWRFSADFQRKHGRDSARRAECLRFGLGLVRLRTRGAMRDEESRGVAQLG